MYYLGVIIFMNILISILNNWKLGFSGHSTSGTILCPIEFKQIGQTEMKNDTVI